MLVAGLVGDDPSSVGQGGCPGSEVLLANHNAGATLRICWGRRRVCRVRGRGDHIAGLSEGTAGTGGGACDVHCDFLFDGGAETGVPGASAAACASASARTGSVPTVSNPARATAVARRDNALRANPVRGGGFAGEAAGFLSWSKGI